MVHARATVSSFAWNAVNEILNMLDRLKLETQRFQGHMFDIKKKFSTQCLGTSSAMRIQLILG